MWQQPRKKNKTNKQIERNRKTKVKKSLLLKKKNNESSNSVRSAKTEYTTVVQTTKNG